ncbi:MAG TPA: OmpA family protein [Solirubrobacteraceae bacterium]|nr:OmpA family protein [Solirubrobacteraceae bacterium]
MASKSRRHRGAGHDNDERWLLTYADMITLLMALFMVLFSISSVNISKYRSLQESLKAAFSGSVMPGGKAILQTGSQSTKEHSANDTAIPSIVPVQPSNSAPSTISAAQLSQAQSIAQAAQIEQNELKHLKDQLDGYLRAHGLGNQVQTTISQRGLVVRVLTDKVLFASGQATLEPQGMPLLGEVAKLLNVDRSHQIVVEGHTDNVPIASSQYPSNWELSTARATTVVRYMISQGVDRQRLSASGYADLHPVASNATEQGRQLNRRVEIVILRNHPLIGG